MSQGNQTSFLEDTLNVLTQVGTAGLVGFGDGGLTAGVTGEPALDLTREITGAAAAEQANEIARQQFEQDQQRIEDQRQDQIAENERRQTQLSRQAGRSTGNAPRRNPSQAAANLDDDLLGL